MPCSRIGSIATSGKPPLPQIARTPYCSPSGSVKRTIRALVVVPMQTFSYFPSATLRTFGAVCSRNAPFRSSGGSTPWSKMRICVRSRMPMMGPSTVTSSPACRSRIASSLAGKVRRLELTVEVDLAVGVHVRRRTARRPALVVDGDRVECHVRVRVFDVALQHGDVSAEAHRPDACLVEQPEQLIFQLRNMRIRIPGPDRPRDRLLREIHRVIGAAADPDADDAGRAWLAASADDRLEHELLDAFHAVGGDAHLQERHVLAAGPLRHALHVEAVPIRDELPVHDREAVTGVRPGVLARDRVDGVRAERVLDRRALGAGLERRVNSCGVQGKMLADAARVNGDAGVLANEVLLGVRDLDVLEDRLQNALAGN